MNTLLRPSFEFLSFIPSPNPYGVDKCYLDRSHTHIFPLAFLRQFLGREGEGASVLDLWWASKLVLIVAFIIVFVRL